MIYEKLDKIKKLGANIDIKWHKEIEIYYKIDGFPAIHISRFISELDSFKTNGGNCNAEYKQHTWEHTVYAAILEFYEKYNKINKNETKN
jgi:hypothetical protein